MALAATALAATGRIKIALMAMSPYSINPIYAAMAAATLAELHPGRVVLSLGVGAPGDLAAAGIETPRPLATLEDAIDTCRALFAGDREGLDAILATWPADVAAYILARLDT